MKYDSQAVNVFEGAWVPEELVQQSHHTSPALPFMSEKKKKMMLKPMLL
mgnify:CR=1 FL=1